MSVIDEKIMACGFVLLVLWLSMPCFVAADLWSGVRKAIQLGVQRTSEGLKRTIDKVARYSNMLLGMTFIDGIQVCLCFALYHWYGWDVVMLPWATAVGAAYVGIVEVKSIMEPADDKERRQMKQVIALAGEIMKHRTEPEEIAEAVVKYLKEDDKKE